MSLALIKKYNLFKKNIIISNSFMVIQHFNYFVNDMKMLRLFCALNKIKLTKYKNKIIKNYFKQNKLNNIFNNTFFNIYFNNFFDNNNILEIMLKLINFITTNKLNFLITYINYKNISLTLNQFINNYINIKDFNLKKLFIHFKLFQLKFFFKFKLCIKKNANN